MSILSGPVKPAAFYLARPHPCPYLAGRVEQKIFTRLDDESGGNFLLNSSLTQSGFRRSQKMLYRPACPSCMECVPVRIVVNDFVASRALKRIAKRNADLKVHVLPVSACETLYPLFIRYQQARHAGGDMLAMPLSEFTAMMQEGGEHAFLLTLTTTDDAVVGVMLADRITNGTSAIYSFFEPCEDARSLGTALIMSLVDYTRTEKLDYVYLGYWIKDSAKMAYKARFSALERLGNHGWERMNTP